MGGHIDQGLGHMGLSRESLTLAPFSQTSVDSWASLHQPAWLIPRLSGIRLGLPAMSLSTVHSAVLIATAKEKAHE